MIHKLEVLFECLWAKRHVPKPYRYQSGFKHGFRRGVCRYLSVLLLTGLFSFVGIIPTTHATEVSEYRLKIAFMYNFIAYTRWPDQTESSLTLCIHGHDAFGENIRHLQGKKVNNSDLLVQYTTHLDELSGCQIIFISQSVMDNLKNILDHIGSRPILTISDTSNASQRGVMINMMIKDGKVKFNANQAAARSTGLELSAQLLRLADEVYR